MRKMKKVKFAGSVFLVGIFVLSVILSNAFSMGLVNAEEHLTDWDYYSSDVVEDFDIYYSSPPSLRFDLNATNSQGCIIQNASMPKDFNLSFRFYFTNNTIEEIDVEIFRITQSPVSSTQIGIYLTYIYDTHKECALRFIEGSTTDDWLYHINITSYWNLMKITRSQDMYYIYLNNEEIYNHTTTFTTEPTNIRFDGRLVGYLPENYISIYLDDIVVEEKTGAAGLRKAEEGFNMVYFIGIGVAVAAAIIVAVFLLRRRTAFPKPEKPTPKAEVSVPEAPIPMLPVYCPECKTTFQVKPKKRPFKTKCPNCGTEGMIR